MTYIFKKISDADKLGRGQSPPQTLPHRHRSTVPLFRASAAAGLHIGLDTVNLLLSVSVANETIIIIIIKKIITLIASATSPARLTTTFSVLVVASDVVCATTSFCAVCAVKSS